MVQQYVPLARMQGSNVTGLPIFSLRSQDNIPEIRF